MKSESLKSVLSLIGFDLAALLKARIFSFRGKMDDLIKIEKDEDGKNTVDARELHEFLGVKSEFRNWIKNRIKKYGFSQNIDFVAGKYLPGSDRIDYYVSVDMAKELSMVENNERGRQARRYFIKVEKRYQLESQQNSNAIDYGEIGKMIGLAVTAALVPIVDRLDKISTQKALPDTVKENTYSLVAYCRIKSITVDRSRLAIHGKELRKIANKRGIELKKIPDERWGFVNSYPSDILDEYFAA